MNYNPNDGFPYYYELAGSSGCNELFSSTTTISLLASIEEEQSNFRYSPGKWSMRQVVRHLVDHERIMMFRAFLLSRKQPVEQWGYPEDSLGITVGLIV